MRRFLIADFRDGHVGANRHNQLARHATVHLRERTGQLLGARAACALDGSGFPRTTNVSDPHGHLNCRHGRFLSSQLRGDGKRKSIVDDGCQTSRGRRRTLPGWNIVSADGGHLPNLRNLFGRSDTQGYRGEHISANVWGDCDVHLGLASDAAQLTQDNSVRAGACHLRSKSTGVHNGGRLQRASRYARRARLDAARIVVLRRALESRGSGRTEAIVDALGFRRERRARFPGAAENEQREEIREGLASDAGSARWANSPAHAQRAAASALAEGASQPSFVGNFEAASGPSVPRAAGRCAAAWVPTGSRYLRATTACEVHLRSRHTPRSYAGQPFPQRRLSLRICSRRISAYK